jgi:hypothetical protein
MSTDGANVVSFARAKETRRLGELQRELAVLMDQNCTAVTCLHASGELFTHPGARLGKQLLSAHESLLEAQTMLAYLLDQGPLPAPRKPASVEELCLKVEQLLSKARALGQRVGKQLARLGGRR